MLRLYLAIDPVVARPASDGSRPVQFRSQLSRPTAGKRWSLATPFRPTPFAGWGGISATGRSSARPRAWNHVIFFLLLGLHGTLCALPDRHRHRITSRQHVGIAEALVVSQLPSQACEHVPVELVMDAGILEQRHRDAHAGVEAHLLEDRRQPRVGHFRADAALPEAERLADVLRRAAFPAPDPVGKTALPVPVVAAPVLEDINVGIGAAVPGAGGERDALALEPDIGGVQSGATSSVNSSCRSCRL